METLARLAASVAARSLRAVFFAGLGDAAGEFDHRFSSRNHPEDVGQALDGLELLVGIEDVEFSFIGAIGGAGILLYIVFAVLRGGVKRVGKLRGHAGKKLRDRFVESVAIVGEVREHAESGAEGNDRDQIGFGHLLPDKFGGGVVGADQVVTSHRGEIEEKNQETAIAGLLALGFRRGIGRGVNGQHDRLGVAIRRSLDRFDVLVGKNGHFLRLAVVRDAELVGLECLKWLAGAVGDLDVDANQIGGAAKDGLRGFAWRLLCGV